jgi:hypothetical protein
MANHTFTTFNYEDDNQKIANWLLQFKKSKVYAVEQMNLDGINHPKGGIAEFYVVADVETKFRKKKTDAFQSLEEFWTFDRMFTKSCPHWERTAVNVTVGIGIRGDTSPDPIINKMVTLSTWFDNKYKNQAEGIANSMLSDGYDETAQLVRAEWNDNCITNNMVEENPLKNGIGIIMQLSKHLEQEHAEHTKEVLDIFAKVKI